MKKRTKLILSVCLVILLLVGIGGYAMARTASGSSFQMWNTGIWPDILWAAL